LLEKKILEQEDKFSTLPQAQQELVRIRRTYDINDRAYLGFLQKRSEASIVMAANVSDINVIDRAKDVGGGLLGPNTQVNYVLAFFSALFFVLIVALVRILLDTRLNKIEELFNEYPNINFEEMGFNENRKEEINKILN
jgi:uncharacterized protein involved in exopolysaccharide biosynthesis